MKMNSNEILKALSEERNWKELRLFVLESLHKARPESHIPIEAIYLLLNNLLYAEYRTDTEYDEIIKILREIFTISNSKFNDSPDYLFFIGYFITLCDWCFGLDDVSIGIESLRRATELEPNSLLFKWGYSFSTSKSDADLLSRKVSQDRDVFSFLTSYGEAGKYIEDQIRNLPYFLSLQKE